MRCSRAREMMSLSLDEEVPPEDTRKLQEHIDECVQCLHHRERIHHISALFGSAPLVKPTDGLVEAVMRRVATAEILSAARGHSTVSLVAAGLLVLCVLGMGNLFVVVSAYGFAQSGTVVEFLSDLIGIVWKLISVVTLLGGIGWEVVWHAKGIAVSQQIVFPLMVCVSLMLTALWAHIIWNYRGVNVSQER
ncbi:MAG: zf-HC2 domain-containing protein [Chloroflexi bacterium]|nr:zf-HC2 domain-containing protein [Chloroflexota bacterium]